MLLSTLAIVAGNVLIVIYSDHEAVVLTGDDLIHIYLNNSPFHYYLISIFVVFCAASWLHRKYSRARAAGRALYAHTIAEPLCFAISSTVLGTFAVLQSKIMAMLIQTSSRGVRNEFEFPVSQSMIDCNDGDMILFCVLSMNQSLTYRLIITVACDYR
jgi:hypothetical protein